MQTATWLVSRELTEAAGPWNTNLLGDDDGEYFCRVKLASEAIKFVPEAKVYYRDTGTNRLSYIGKSSKKMDAQFTSMKLHIGYLRSLEDSERTRAACVRYLQRYMFDFLPERVDIAQRMEKLAGELGGKISAPRAPWKYAWLQVLFGWPTAKRAQVVLPRIKASFFSAWDKAWFQMARREGTRSGLIANPPTR
jgi:hypothetical protein